MFPNQAASWLKLYSKERGRNPDAGPFSNDFGDGDDDDDDDDDVDVNDNDNDDDDDVNYERPCVRQKQNDTTRLRR